MSHRHSFNTQPRKRMRQKAALERWEDRIKYCSESLKKFDDPNVEFVAPHLKGGWVICATTARAQRDILKRKLGY